MKKSVTEKRFELTGKARNVLTRPEALVWIILSILIIFCITASPLFLSSRNLKNVFLVQPIGLGLASLGQAIVVISGAIDLSIGSVISLLTSLAAGIYKSNPGFPPVLMVLLMAGMGAFTGAINGFIVVKLRVTPIMATLATMSIYQGAVLFYTKKTIGGIPKTFRFISDGRLLGIPFPIILFLITLALCFYLLNRNKLGKYIYAVGSDVYVSQISGIPVQRVQFLAYLICGTLIGVASTYLASRMGGGGPKVGMGYELDSVTAVVIGGVSLSGGYGNLFGVFAGVLIIGVFSNIMNLMSVNAFLQIVLKGIVLIIAVSFYARKRTGGIK